MPDTYLHGAYGHLDDSVVQEVTTSATVPVYFGTAPVGLVRGDVENVNVPMKISSLADARAKIGHSEDFASYTLCEAVAAHFDNGGTGCGPIYVVNVLDPDVHRKNDETEVAVSLVNGRVSHATDSAILDTLRVERPEVDGEPQASHAHKPIEAAMEASGVSYEDGLITYEPTGTIDQSLVHDGVPYIGIVFDAPDGATAATLYLNGEKANDFDLTSDSEFVTGGDPLHWFGFAQLDGSPRTPTAWEVRLEWTGSEVKETACRVCRYTRDYVEGTDYTLDYNSNNGSIVITSVDGRVPDGRVNVAYREMDPTAVTPDDVVGMVTSDGAYSGIEALALLYQEQFVVPNLLAAPGWSHVKKVYDALVDRSAAINGHWDAFVVADLPLSDEDGEAVDTIDKAIQWKAENNFTSERSMVCWPMAEDAEGRLFHVSTLAAEKMLEVDQGNDGVPFESCSNKPTVAVRQHFGDGSKNRGFDQQTGNRLNERGITTVVGWAGAWVLWGPHTAAYDYEDPTVDPRAYFATNVRMLMHITNDFQQEWSDEIDEPMTRALRDRIVNREQEKLDSYVTQGALIGAPRIRFIQAENPTTSLMEGDFRWDVDTTPTPPLKSATAYVRYTDAGLASYFE